MYFSQFILEYVISFAILIFILVFIHELGHFLFARLCGVKVECFSIGFGKELFGYTDKKGTRWKISPIPLGGYVKMKGEMISSAAECSTDPDAFHNKKLWQKTLIVFAGPLFNLLFPFIVFFLIPLFFGVSDFKPKIKNVLPQSKVHNILKPEDLIIEINNQKINSFSEVYSIVSKIPDQKAQFVILRDNRRLVLDILIGSQTVGNKKIGFLGIEVDTISTYNKRTNLLDSIKVSYVLYKQTMSNILYGFKLLLTGKVSYNEVGGPIKIAQLSGETIKYGLDRWLMFLGILSINLAIINLMPIPALDGGYLFMYLIQFITRKPVPIRYQYIAITMGFFFLLFLVALITFKDIVSLFS